MTTFFFPDCRLDVHSSGETLARFCPSGHVLERLPRPSQDREIARFLGYGSDTLRFRREHDLLLHTLAVLQGLGCSPTLWALAHEDDLRATFSPARDEEENLAVHVHRWLNLDIWSDEIESLLAPPYDRHEMREFLRAVLEGEITRIETSVFDLATV